MMKERRGKKVKVCFIPPDPPNKAPCWGTNLPESRQVLHETHFPPSSSVFHLIDWYTHNTRITNPDNYLIPPSPPVAKTVDMKSYSYSWIQLHCTLL